MAEQTFLQADGVGESPLTEYPGQIKFPLVMTLAMHKVWQRFVNERVDRSETDLRIGVAFADAGTPDGGQRVPFLYDDAELALLFGDLDVTGPDSKKITSKTKVDALPLPVAVWIAKVYREWENSQLLFRWSGVAGLASSDSAA